MLTFAPVFSHIVHSSLWQEPYYVRILFLTMMVQKDSDHVVRGSAYNIARWANMTEAEVLDGLKILSSPDTRRLEPQEYEGRRIEKTDDGWLILNAHKYEDKMREVAEKARKAKWARDNRARKQAESAALGPESGLADLERRANGIPHADTPF